MKSANVVVQQHRCKLLKMGMLMPEICWESKKKNKNSKSHLTGFLILCYSCSNKVSVHPIHVRALCNDFWTSWHFQWNSVNITVIEATPPLKNAKVVPVHDMKACRGNRDIAPLILNLGTGCRWVGLPSLPYSQFVFFIFAISHLCVPWNILGSSHRFLSLKRLFGVTYTPFW